MEEFKLGRNSAEAMRIAFTEEEIAARAFVVWGKEMEPELKRQIS